MSLYLLSMMLIVLDGPIEFNAAVSLAPVDDESDFFMEEPVAFDYDASGNFYILDSGAKTIFTWDKQGQFKGTIGKPGQGPGELVISGRGPGGGFINTVGDRLFLMDARKKKIIVFNEGTFEKELPIRLARGRILNWSVMDEDRYLFHWRRRGDDNFINEMVIVDGEGKALETLESQPDDSFQMKRQNGRRSFKIKAFNPTLVSYYDRTTGDLLVGNSGEPSFKVIGKDKKSRTIKVPLSRLEVDQDVKNEFAEQFTSRRFKPQIEFPDKKAFYTHLISLGDKGFLVYDQSPFYRNINGVHLAKDGSVVGRFNMELGEQGALMASRDKIMCVSMDEDDEFTLRELNIGK